MTWTYDAGDPSILLFTRLLERYPRTVPAGGMVLELGASETDWLERARAQNPRVAVVGVDTRPDRDSVRPGNAMDPMLSAPGALDAVVMLGALEHFGLGFYGDPLAEDGDVQTMQNVARWLKPGGWVYFDVPCNPTDYVTENRHFRVYSPETVGRRLLVEGLVEIGRIYTTHEPRDGILPRPPTSHRKPYHYCAVLAEHAAA